MPSVPNSATVHPPTPEALADLLATAAAANRTINLTGTNTKRTLAGPTAPADVHLTTRNLNQVLQYEPRDLTVGVGSGMNFADLSRLLAANGQMIPLDGPWSDEGTVGGLIAANISGSRRRLYGTARDLVIGMEFATLDGNLVQSGGMVVKNVAGLDMAKVMIGSFGTLAAITRVNFKLVPVPAASRTVLLQYDDAATAAAAALAAIRNVVTPVAVDVLNPLFTAASGAKGYTLALLFGGNDAVIERSLKIAETFGKTRPLASDDEARFWNFIRGATPLHMDKFAEGAVARIATPIADVGKALSTADGPAMAHAGNGIVRQWFTRPETAAKWLSASATKGWNGVIEAAGDSSKQSLDLWPNPGGDIAIMKQIKHMFDPKGLLNSGRLYGRL